MCGRYILAQAAKFERAVRLGKVSWNFEPSYNVAPTQAVPVIRTIDGLREGLMMRWGLIPFFARGVPPRYSTINATVEKLETGPCWRTPWKRGQRCIQLAAGFYEWHLGTSGKKQPYFIHLADHEVFGFASIWDRSIAEDGAATESCALVTLPGNALMREIHNAGANPYRMPAILAPEQFARWIEGTREDARALLEPYPAELMVAYAVSPRVNSPRNNGPELLEPAPTQDPAAQSA
jgi:putative SOS response-associated peptidase YedK